VEERSLEANEQRIILVIYGLLEVRTSHKSYSNKITNRKKSGSMMPINDVGVLRTCDIFGEAVGLPTSFDFKTNKVTIDRSGRVQQTQVLNFRLIVDGMERSREGKSSSKGGRMWLRALRIRRVFRNTKNKNKTTKFNQTVARGPRMLTNEPKGSGGPTLRRNQC